MKIRIKSSLPILFLLSICCFLPSCSKSDNLVWEGRVLEYGTNKPINNATLVLYRGSGEILGGVSFEAIDTLVTGANGEYKFKFIDGPYGYKIIAKAHLYYDKDESQNVISNGKTKKDLILDPHAWLRLKINAPDKDVFQFVIHTFGCNPREFLIHDGEKSAETFCLLKGNRENRVEFNIGIYGGNSINEVINPFLTGLDTTTIELNY